MLDRRLFAAALLGTALGALHIALIGTGSPRAVEELGGGDLYSLVPVAYLVATVLGALAAWVLDRHRFAPELLVLGLGAFAAGVLLATISTGMPQLVLARAISGLGAGALFAVAVALAGADPRRHALTAAVYAGAFALGPLAGDVATGAVGWRLSLGLTVVVALMTLGYVALAGGSRVPVAPPPPTGHVAGAGSGARALALFAAALVGAAAFGPVIFLPVAGSIGIVGGDGVPSLALPLALAAVVGALLAPRLPAIGGLRAELPAGLLVIAIALLVRLGGAAQVGPTGWLIAAAVGLGVGLALAGGSWLVVQAAGSRWSPVEVAARQVGGLVGLGVATAALFGTLLDQLVADLRPIVDEVVAQVPAPFQLFARGAADEALRTLGRELSAANIGGGDAGAPQTFADIVIARIPADFQALAAPYVDRLNEIFAGALTSALAAAFTAGVVLAAAGLGVGLAAAWLARSRPAEPSEAR